MAPMEFIKYDTSFFMKNNIVISLYHRFERDCIRHPIPSMVKRDLFMFTIIEAFNYTLRNHNSDPLNVSKTLVDSIENAKGLNPISIFGMKFKPVQFSNNKIYDERNLPINNSWLIRKGLDGIYNLEMRLLDVEGNCLEDTLESQIECPTHIYINNRVTNDKGLCIINDMKKPLYQSKENSELTVGDYIYYAIHNLDKRSSTNAKRTFLKYTLQSEIEKYAVRFNKSYRCIPLANACLKHFDQSYMIPYEDDSNHKINTIHIELFDINDLKG